MTQDTRARFEVRGARFEVRDAAQAAHGVAEIKLVGGAQVG
jgi:hypothetical protein